MRKLVPLIGLALLAFPGAAQAHTGTVTCDSTGVVFHYNANFERRTIVTETVGAPGQLGAQRLVVVERHRSSSDTWAGVAGTVTASATWHGGGIAERTLVCPPPPLPPPVTSPPPAAPPAPPAAPPAPPAAPPAPPVAPPAAPPVALPPPAPCPPGYRLHVTHGTRMCLQSKPRIRRGAAPRCEVGRRVKVIRGYVICLVKVKVRAHTVRPGGTAG
jgi:hypothetical protein